MRSAGDGGLWAGMWGLVCREDERGDLVDWVKRAVGLDVEDIERVGGFEHQTTHLKIGFKVSVARVAGGEIEAGGGCVAGAGWGG